jgi:competence protein ComGC
MNRFDIVGLTLAEISLVLLFSFIAIFVPSYARARKELDAKTNKATNSDVEKQLIAAKAENTQLQQELQNSRRNLRSVVTPSCVEISKATDWLFTAVIRGSDDYEVQGQQYTLDALLAKYSPELVQAKQNSCVHRIRIYYGQDLSGLDYDYSLRRIEKHFYTQKLGPEQGAAK